MSAAVAGIGLFVITIIIIGLIVTITTSKIDTTVNKVDDGTGDNTNDDPPTKPIDKYTFFKHNDSGGGDIILHEDKAGDIDWLAEKCIDDNTCIAFNDKGWLKDRLDPRSEFGTFESDKSDEGLWINKGYLKVLDDYTYHKGKDSSGGNIKLYEDEANNLGWLAYKCSEDDTCLGFTSLGWLKNELIPESEYDTLGDEHDPLTGLFVKK